MMGDRLNRPERKMIKGNSVEEKIDSIDKALVRLDRHTSKSVDVIIPPMPISGYSPTVTEYGDIFNFIFPLKGTVRRVVMSIDRIIGKFKAAPLYIDFMSEGKIVTHALMVGVGTKEQDIGLVVKVGDKVAVRGELGDGEHTPKVEGIWFSLLVDVDMDENKVKRMIMDDIISEEV